jgi:hypothetical protein
LVAPDILAVFTSGQNQNGFTRPSLWETKKGFPFRSGYRRGNFCTKITKGSGGFAKHEESGNVLFNSV